MHVHTLCRSDWAPMWREDTAALCSTASDRQWWRRTYVDYIRMKMALCGTHSGTVLFSVRSRISSSIDES